MTNLEAMEKHYTKLQEVTSYSARRNHLDACIHIYESDPEVHHYFIYRPTMRCLEMRFERKSIISEELNCPASNITNRKELPIYKINCYGVASPCEFSGLYFIGDIKYDPTYGKIFLVKVGSSRCVNKRVNQYLTHNPMFYCNNTVLPYVNYYQGEENAHKFLTRVAIGRPTYSKEWFIVDENTYFELCNKFTQHSFFKAVADGYYNV